MDRYYSTLKNLPSEILLSNPQARLEDIKNSRWLTRDTFLQMSQEPFAAANGIGPDHLQNFLNLQDAVVSKLLIQKLENGNTKTAEKLKICGLLQLIFTESPKLIEFLFSTPTDLTTVNLLIQNCPALFNLINLFKDFRTVFICYNHNFNNKFYYWQTILFLSQKYPIQSTLDLSWIVVEEILIELETNKSDHQITLITSLFDDFVKLYPFLNEFDVRNALKKAKLS